MSENDTNNANPKPEQEQPNIIDVFIIDLFGSAFADLFDPLEFTRSLAKKSTIDLYLTLFNGPGMCGHPPTDPTDLAAMAEIVNRNVDIYTNRCGVEGLKVLLTAVLHRLQVTPEYVRKHATI